MVSSIGGINKLQDHEKRQIYARLVPPAIIQHFHLNPFLTDDQGNDLLRIKGNSGSSAVEISLFHEVGFSDPVLYGHLEDTLSGKLHILLYVINDPHSPRYDVDRMPDGSKTNFGVLKRNLEAERAAMEAGLAPGQIRSGLRMLSDAEKTFEAFVLSLEQDLYYIEPLYYHNAVIFENHGFAYQVGRRKMLGIQEGFTKNGFLTAKLDGSTPFRVPGMESSIRLRSWAIHDNILEEPFQGVTMYKVIGESAHIRTTPDIPY